MEPVIATVSCIERHLSGETFIVYFGKKYLPRTFHLSITPHVVHLLERYWKGLGIQTIPIRFRGLPIDVTVGTTIRLQDEWGVYYLYKGNPFYKGL